MTPTEHSPGPVTAFGQGSLSFAATDAPKNKGGKAPVDAAAPIQDMTMLNIAEKPTLAKSGDGAGTPFVKQSADKQAFDWLAEMVQRSRHKITTTLVTLTPALARVLLEANPDNRVLSDMYVDNYARDIDNGNWALNGEAIVVSRDGLLNDGQHRCAAVVRVNKPIDVVMVFGAERETRLTLDQGRARLTADYLSMNGHKDASALAAVAGFVWQYSRSGKISRHHKHRPTKGEILAAIDIDPSIAEAMSVIPRRGSDGAGGRSTLAFCYWVIARHATPIEAQAFILSLINGDNLLSRDPVLYAHNRLLTERTRLNPNEKAELIFRAWNAHRKRETPKSLMILDGPLPELER